MTDMKEASPVPAEPVEPNYDSKHQGAALKKHTLSGFIWTFSSTGAKAVVEIISALVLARILSKADFGIVAAAMIVVNISFIFSQLGIGPAIVQRPTLEQRHISSAYVISLGFSVAFAALIFLGAPLCAWFFNMPQLVPVIRLLSISFILNGVSIVPEFLMNRALHFRKLARIDIVSSLVGYAGTAVVLALLGAGAYALVGATLAQAALRSTQIYLASPFKKTLKFEREAFRELIYFGGMFTVARLFNYIAGWGDNIVVGRWLGPAPLGLYGRAYQLMVAPATLFGQVLDRVLFPIMSRVQEDAKALANYYTKGVAIIGLVALPTSVMLFVLAPELIHILLGKKWDGAILPFQILAVGMLFRTSYKVSDSLTRAVGAVKSRAFQQLLYAATVIGGAYIGMVLGMRAWGNDAGLVGVSYGVLAAITLNYFGMAHLSLKELPIGWKEFFQAHIPGVVLTLAVSVFFVPFTGALRAAHLPGAAVAILGIGFFTIGLYASVRIWPRRFLGSDGLWLMETIYGNAPGKVSRLLKRALPWVGRTA